MTTIISIFKQSAMERSASTAVKDDVASAAEETLQFDDDNLRGEKLKQYLLSVTKYQRQRNCTRFKIPMYRPLSPCQVWGVSILVSQTLDSSQSYQICKLELQFPNLVHRSSVRNLKQKKVRDLKTEHIKGTVISEV